MDEAARLPSAAWSQLKRLIRLRKKFPDTPALLLSHKERELRRRRAKNRVARASRKVNRKASR